MRDGRPFFGLIFYHLPDIYYYHFPHQGSQTSYWNMIRDFIQLLICYYWKDYYHPENRWHSLVANWFDVTLAGV